MQEKLIHDTAPKQIWSRDINGNQFAYLLSEYVESINERGKVDFTNAWDKFMFTEIELRYTESMNEIEE